MSCDCRSLEPKLAPYVDGEAEPDVRADVEAHIGACPSCRERVTTERAAREVLQARRHELRGSATEHLRRRCAAQRAKAAPPLQPVRQPGFLGRIVMPLAMAASLLLVIGTIFFLGLNRGVELLAAQLAVDHVKCHHFASRASRAGHASHASHASNDARPDPVLLAREWSDERGWRLNIPASAAQYQLELLGVRRCGSTEGTNAHIMYKWQGAPLSVYVMNGESKRAGEVEQFVTKAGQDAIIWNQNGRMYAVVAQGNPDELRQIVKYVKLSTR